MILKNTIKYFFAFPSIKLASRWPAFFAISVMRKLNKIQLSTEQLRAISINVKKQAPCKLLIFGVGNDSVFWSNLNRGGTTVFLEDNQKWLSKVMGKSKNVTAFLVDYNTRRTEWKALLETPSLLNMTLPDEVKNKEWDVILVDGPAGWNDKGPGRMKSIFHSARLIRGSGDIFVHDCAREVESIYCDKFLQEKNLTMEIKAPVGILRHYHMRNRPV